MESQKSKRADINDVYKLACTDEKFLDALLTNADSALEKVRLNLPEPDRKKLKEMLEEKMTVTGGDLMKYTHSFYNSLMKSTNPPPPPPPWRIELQKPLR